MRTLETTILAAAKRKFCNAKLRLKDIAEWSTAEIEPKTGEVVEWIEDPGVFVCVATEHDRRKA